MRPTEIIVLVRKAADVAVIIEAGAAAGWRKVLAQVAGEPGAPTPAQLRRVRRSADVRKRRLPVLVWVATGEEEEQWRNAGAYVVRGAVNKAVARKALEAIARGGEEWIESAAYVGPCRRRRHKWMSPVRRLADGATYGKQEKALVDASSFATQMRQLRHGAFGFERADRDRRAQYLADVRRTVKAAERSRQMHAVAAIESLARYLAACGATGRIDEALIERHLTIAEGSPVDAATALARVTRAVDQAIGLSQPA
jgi:hypothetical protein